MVSAVRISFSFQLLIDPCTVLNISVQLGVGQVEERGSWENE